MSAESIIYKNLLSVKKVIHATKKKPLTFNSAQIIATNLAIQSTLESLLKQIRVENEAKDDFTLEELGKQMGEL